MKICLDWHVNEKLQFKWEEIWSFKSNDVLVLYKLVLLALLLECLPSRGHCSMNIIVVIIRITIQVTPVHLCFQVLGFSGSASEQKEENHHGNEKPCHQVSRVLWCLLYWLEAFIIREAAAMGKCVIWVGRNTLEISKHVSDLCEDIDTKVWCSAHSN